MNLHHWKRAPWSVRLFAVALLLVTFLAGSAWIAFWTWVVVR